MQILHITDLHFDSGQPFQVALIEALLKDIKKRVADGFSPDFAVFSGDLVRNPDTLDIFELFETNFLKPILTAAKLLESEVIFCPGNHERESAVVKGPS